MGSFYRGDGEMQIVIIALGMFCVVLSLVARMLSKKKAHVEMENQIYRMAIDMYATGGTYPFLLDGLLDDKLVGDIALSAISDKAIELVERCKCK